MHSEEALFEGWWNSRIPAAFGNDITVGDLLSDDKKQACSVAFHAGVLQGRRESE